MPQLPYPREGDLWASPALNVHRSCFKLPQWKAIVVPANQQKRRNAPICNVPPVRTLQN